MGDVLEVLADLSPTRASRCIGCHGLVVRLRGCRLEDARRGGALKLLTVLDEHTRECLAIVVAARLADQKHDVLEVLADLFVRHGPPEYASG